MLTLISSIFIYTIFAIIMFFCARYIDGKNVNGHWYSMPSGYWIALFVFALVSGLRWDVGVDYLAYLESYERALNGLEYVRDRGIEEGYAFVTNVFAAIGLHPTIYFAFLAALQLVFILWALKNEQKLVVAFALAVIVLDGHYFILMNGIRQTIAACSFVWAVMFIQNKRLFPYLIWLAFAYTWHHSALLLLPVFLLAYDKSTWNRPWLNIGILGICLILGNTPTWVASITQLGDILQLLGYQNYADNLEEITNTNNYVRFTFGPRMFVNMTGYILVLFYYPKVRAYFEQSTIDIYFKLFFIGICAYYLFVNTNQLFLRPVIYFTIFAIPMIAYTLTYLYKSRRLLAFAIMLFSTMTFTYLCCFADAGLPETYRTSYLYQFYQF